MEITYSMTIIAMILLACTLGAINALFSYFLDFCFWEGNIFGFWQPFIAKICLRFKNPEKLKALQSAKDNPEYENMLIAAAGKIFLFKVLGGCAPCTNIWIGFISFFFINPFIGLGWVYAIPYLLFSSYILRKIMKI